MLLLLLFRQLLPMLQLPLLPVDAATVAADDLPLPLQHRRRLPDGWKYPELQHRSGSRRKVAEEAKKAIPIPTGHPCRLILCLAFRFRDESL